MTYARRSTPLDELSAEQLMHLAWGSTYFGDGFTDADVFRQAWELHREDVVGHFNRTYRNQTYARCFAWWFCEGHERPVVNPHFGLDEIEMARKGPKQADHFGFLATHILGGPELEPLQEPEWSYLGRLGLLTDEERVFLAAMPAQDDDE
jgi:hypothetical protein